MSVDGSDIPIPVSIHAPTWGATSDTDDAFFTNLFQSTHPHGVRRLLNVIRRLRICFNPRTHMGCDKPRNGFATQKSSFNPRTHMGCDQVDLMVAQKHLTVSIHAPTWGATIHSFIFDETFKVSIHAPTWGATHSLLRCIKDTHSFNPRTHMGCDLNFVNRFVRNSSFNPRTHMGCDVKRKI